MKLYLVLNDGEIVTACQDPEEANGKAEMLTDLNIQKVVEESGREMDDLTDEELAEFAIYNGANGGYYETVVVDVDVNAIEELNTDLKSVALENDLEFTYSEIYSALEEVDFEDLFSEEFDNDFEGFEDFDEEDFTAEDFDDSDFDEFDNDFDDFEDDNETIDF